MKKIGMLVLPVLLMLCFMAGCGDNTNTPSNTDQPQSGASDTPLATTIVTPSGAPRVGNPIVDVDNIQAIMDQLEVTIILPEEATDVRCSMIDDIVGQVLFIYGNDNYELRASRGNVDHSGVYEAHEVWKDMLWEDYPYKIRYTEGGTGLTYWYDEGTDTFYSVYMPLNASEEKLEKITKVIAPVG